MAFGRARVAGAPAVAQQVDVQLELLPGRREREHLVVQALERRAGLQQVQARADARDVRVDGHVAQAVGEQQHAGGCLAPDAGQRDEVVARLVSGARGSQSSESSCGGSRGIVGDRAQDRLDAHGLDLGDAAGADRLLDLGDGRVAHGLPGGEARAQAQEGDVAVAVVGRLREHGQHELGDRMPVRGASAGRRRPRAGGRERARRARARAASRRRAGAWRGALGGGGRHRVTVTGNPHVPRYPRAVPEVTRPRRRDRRAAGLLARRVAGGGGERRLGGSAGNGRADEAVPLYLHGVPDSSDVWLEFLARSGGLAPDLPGFGRSGKPGSLSFTIDEYADFVESFLELVGVERVSMVVHDWGAVGLAFAQRHPRAHRAPGGDQRGAAAGGLPLAPHGANLAHAGAGRAGDGHDERAHAALAVEGGQRNAGADAAAVAQRACWSTSTRARSGRSCACIAARRRRCWRRRASGWASWACRRWSCGASATRTSRRASARRTRRCSDADLLELADAGHWAWLDRPDVIDRVVEFVGAASG